MKAIEKTLDAMEAWVGRVRSQPDLVERDELGRFVSFLREFVDDCHHAKEEDILFATTQRSCGNPRSMGPSFASFAGRWHVPATFRMISAFGLVSRY